MRVVNLAALIGVLVLAGGLRGAFAQPIVTDPMLPEHAARQVSPHVYVILGYPNIGIVVGDQATLVVDTGVGARNGAVVERTARELPSKGQKLYLTTTHYHPEHASGQGGFSAGTPVIRPKVQQAELEADGPRIMALFASRSAQMKSLLQGAGIGHADSLFDREYDLDLGGVHARLLYLGAAHTKGDEIVFVPEDSLILPGDVVQNKISPNISCDSCSPRHWIAVLDQVAALKPMLVIPDHGGLGTGALIAQERAFPVDLQERAMALKAQDKSAAQAGQQIAAEFVVKYAGWQTLRNIPQSVQRAYADNR